MNKSSLFTILSAIALGLSKKGSMGVYYTPKHLKALKAYSKNKARAENVTHIRLNQAGLEEIPEEVTKFPNLESLDLARNKITKIPQWIYAIPSLRNIDLRANRITDIPDLDASHMEYIYVDQNRLETIPKGLRFIDKYKFGTPSRVHLHNLTEEELVERLREGLSPSDGGMISNHKRFTSGFSGNAAKHMHREDLSDLEKALVFEYIPPSYREGTDVYELPEALKMFPNIHTISIKNSEHGTEHFRITPEFSVLAKVKHLRFENTPVDLSGLVYFPNVKSLEIVRSHSCINPQSITSLKKLESLTLTGVWGFDRLPKLSPTVTQLSIAMLRLRKLPKNFGQLRKLSYLSFSYTTRESMGYRRTYKCEDLIITDREILMWLTQGMNSYTFKKMIQECEIKSGETSVRRY